jgi:hypothetical protein
MVLYGSPMAYAASFALGFFGLLESDRDFPFVVTRQDLRSRSGWWVSQKFKGETMGLIFAHCRKRKLPS